MLPWLWMWAPQVHWPFSGDVAQDISPDTRWFFQGIPPEAGVAELEQKIFETHSYGRQLGALMPVLLDLAERVPPGDATSQRRLEELKTLCLEIEQVKARHDDRLAETAAAALERLRQRDPAALQRVLARYLPA